MSAVIKNRIPSAPAIQDLFNTIMERCRLERRQKTGLTLRALAKQLGKTENYLSSVEHAREIPSLKTFLEYLVAVGFDTQPLCRLEIPTASNVESSDKRSEAGVEGEVRKKLINKIYSLEPEAVSFLLEQSKLTDVYNFKSRGRQRGRPRKAKL